MFTRPLAVLVAAALVATPAVAGDLLIGGADTIYQSPMFNFEGFYTGVTAGLGNVPVDGGVGQIGVVAGSNFALTEGLLAGVEFQGGLNWNDTGVTGADALFLGKGGGYLAEETLLYGTAGAGWVNGEGSYAAGVGIEQAITDSISVRGEGMATGTWGEWFDGGRLTGGVLWHMN